MDFEKSLKQLYMKWNANGKRIQVVAISGDENDKDYRETMRDTPWVCLPLDATDSELDKINEVIPCVGFPTAGVVNKHGKVLHKKLGATNFYSLEKWLEESKASLAIWPDNIEKYDKMKL